MRVRNERERFAAEAIHSCLANHGARRAPCRDHGELFPGDEDLIVAMRICTRRSRASKSFCGAAPKALLGIGVRDIERPGGPLPPSGRRDDPPW